MVRLRLGRLIAASALAGVLHAPATAGPLSGPLGPNRPPAAAATRVTVEPGRVSAPFAPAADPEGLPLQLQVIAPPKRGTVSLRTDATVTYAAGSTRGPDAFTVRAIDRAGAATDVTVAVTIPNVAPDPNLTRVKLRTGDVSGPFRPAFDRNGEAVFLSLVTPPKAGSVTLLADGQVSYASAKAHVGAVADRFVLRARDALNAGRDIVVDVDIGVTVTAWVPKPVLAGGGGDDVIVAVHGDGEIRGEGGDDRLVGSPGRNVLLGGTGDDVLDGRGLPNDTDKAYWETKDYAIHDVLDGGPGIDTVTYEASPRSDWLDGGVEIDLAGKIARGGHARWDQLSGIENVRGSAYDDRLTGDGGPNLLEGGAGADVLAGGGGDDVLIGGEAVASGPANGFFGRGDVLAGGAGADRHVFRTLADSPASSPDRIAGFSAAEGDVLDLAGLDGDPAKAGVQKPALVPAFTGKPGQARIGPSGRADWPHALAVDRTGDRQADFLILFDREPDPARIVGVVGGG